MNLRFLLHLIISLLTGEHGVRLHEYFWQPHSSEHKRKLRVHLKNSKCAKDEHHIETKFSSYRVQRPRSHRESSWASSLLCTLWQIWACTPPCSTEKRQTCPTKSTKSMQTILRTCVLISLAYMLTAVHVGEACGVG